VIALSAALLRQLGEKRLKALRRQKRSKTKLSLALLTAFSLPILAMFLGGCSRAVSVETFDLNSYLTRQEGVQMYAGETKRSLEQEAESGNIEAISKLGVYSLLGYGGTADPTLANKYLTKAALAGNKRAELCLGVLNWQKTKGKPKDDPDATKIRLQAYKLLLEASKGIGQDAETARELAVSMEKDLPSDKEEAIKRLEGLELIPADPEKIESQSEPNSPQTKPSESSESQATGESKATGESQAEEIPKGTKDSNK